MQMPFSPFLKGRWRAQRGGFVLKLEVIFIAFEATHSTVSHI
jgi:hypothetical protein